MRVVVVLAVTLATVASATTVEQTLNEAAVELRAALAEVKKRDQDPCHLALERSLPRRILACEVLSTRAVSVKALSELDAAVNLSGGLSLASGCSDQVQAHLGEAAALVARARRLAAESRDVAAERQAIAQSEAAGPAASSRASARFAPLRVRSERSVIDASPATRIDVPSATLTGMKGAQVSFASRFRGDGAWSRWSAEPAVEVKADPFIWKNAYSVALRHATLRAQDSSVSAYWVQVALFANGALVGSSEARVDLTAPRRPCSSENEPDCNVATANP